MFALSVVDHLRLDSKRLEQNYMVHARAAERMTGIVFRCRIGIAAFLAATAVVAITAFFVPGRLTQATAAIAATVALLTFALYAALGLESRLSAHRVFAQRLWLVVERYRSLLSEVHEQIVDMPALLRRRDELIRDVHTIYDFEFGADHSGYETARLAPAENEPAA
jgi:hypothetical protein